MYVLISLNDNRIIYNSFLLTINLISPHQVGTGVVIANKDGTWSAPSAIGLGGIGFGFMVGAEVKDIVMVVMDDTTLEALSVSNIVIYLSIRADAENTDKNKNN